MNGLTALASLACTMCDTALGQQVRAGIFDDKFWPTLVAVLAPFPVLLVAAALAPAAIGIPAPAKQNKPAPHENHHK